MNTQTQAIVLHLDKDARVLHFKNIGKMKYFASPAVFMGEPLEKILGDPGRRVIFSIEKVLKSHEPCSYPYRLEERNYTCQIVYLRVGVVLAVVRLAK